MSTYMYGKKKKKKAMIHSFTISIKLLLTKLSVLCLINHLSERLKLFCSMRIARKSSARPLQHSTLLVSSQKMPQFLTQLRRKIALHNSVMIEIQGPELEFGRILNNPHHLYKNKTDDGQKL